VAADLMSAVLLPAFRTLAQVGRCQEIVSPAHVFSGYGMPAFRMGHGLPPSLFTLPLTTCAAFNLKKAAATHGPPGSFYKLAARKVKVFQQWQERICSRVVGAAGKMPAL
jgi:hypothetical protein